MGHYNEYVDANVTKTIENDSYVDLIGRGGQDLLELVDLPTLECRRLETRLSLLYKIINKLCYFDEGTFTVSTSLSHHAPHNLVLNRPFARTNSYFVPQTIFHWNKLDSSIVCASSVHAFNRYLHVHSTSLV